MNKNVVLIADVIDNHDNISLNNNDLECITKSYFNNLYGALTELSCSVKHYMSLEDFINNINTHKNDIVLSVWSGKLSRNRKVLVPSICEAYNIAYVGADPYVGCICQDKTLSKHIAKKHGIKSAESKLFEHVCHPNDLNNLKLPLVIKPNFEGGSNGVSQKNIVFSYEEAAHLCNLLREYFAQPIMIEEYIEGMEVCVTIAGKNGIIDVMEADAIVIDDGKEEYPMFGYEAKKSKTIKYQHEPASHLLTTQMRNAFKSLFNSLGKVDILRIDGKIFNNEFILIELTSDVSLDLTASVAYDFKLAGYEYKDMLRMLLSYSE